MMMLETWEYIVPKSSNLNGIPKTIIQLYHWLYTQYKSYAHYMYTYIYIYCTYTYTYTCIYNHIYIYGHAHPLYNHSLYMIMIIIYIYIMHYHMYVTRMISRLHPQFFVGLALLQPLRAAQVALGSQCFLDAEVVEHHRTVGKRQQLW